MDNRKELISYLESLSVFLLGIGFLLFPLMFTSLTTDPFTLPKQIVVGTVLLLILLITGVKMITEKAVKLRRTPFDLAVVLLTLAVLLSTLFAVNRTDSIMAMVPFLFAVFAYFATINLGKDKKSVLFLVSCLLGGAVIVSLIAILSFLKIYPLPFAYSHSPAFSPVGSLLDQVIYLVLVLPIAFDLSWPLISNVFSGKAERSSLDAVSGHKKDTAKNTAFLIGSLVILAALVTTIYQLATSQKPILLPFETGFQTAFAAISQDTGRIAQGFFFGSGFGTYVTDFARFKQASFNLNQNLWAITFFRSSSFVLELLATTGILGILAFIFLIYKIVKERPVFVSLILAIAVAFLLPFSFTTITLFFVLLGIFSAIQGLKHESRYFDVELQLVALRKGLLSLEGPSSSRSDKSRVLPYLFFAVIVVIVAILGFYSGKYLIADIYFQRSLVAASQNNGSETYRNQVKAITAFNHSDAYNRIFSQTNLALANNLSLSVPKDSTPSAQTTQTIYTLIQQSINAGRSATAISPLTAMNWQNLATIYKSLIGFGQNADQFAVLASQQAILLDPNNPQGYINLGGVYYSIGDWNSAIAQFQVAVSLKPDYPNAYYNLGHALEQKGDLENALNQYLRIRELVANDKPNLDKINAEIDALQKRIQNVPVETSQTPSESNDQSLNLSSPSAQLPPQNPPVKIPAPNTKVTPAPSEAPQPTPSL